MKFIVIGTARLDTKDAWGGTLTPTGLVSVGPAFLRRVIALYALLAVIALAMLALIAHRNDDGAHAVAHAPKVELRS